MNKNTPILPALAYLAFFGMIAVLHGAPLTGASPHDRALARHRTHGARDGTSVTATKFGARLHCASQHLDGEVTGEGLWLTSTERQEEGRVRVTATAFGQGDSNAMLPTRGEVSIAGKTVRFVRPGLVEEYTVSIEGVRQDFVVMEKPPGATGGELCVELAVQGARVAETAYGAELVFERGGRKIAFSKLKVTDATGTQLPARLVVAASAVLPDRKCRTALGVVVSDHDAVYPVRIDPTFSDANWISMTPGATDYSVTAAVVDDSGNLYVAGSTLYGSRSNIAKWDGSKWSPMGPVLDGRVHALTVSGGDLYAGGDFRTVGGITVNGIAKWDGSVWSGLAGGMDRENPIHEEPVVLALAVSGRDLYAGGFFGTAGGTRANHIAKWDGTQWSALGSGVHDDQVEALAILGTDLYVGGEFERAGEVVVNNIAKWDGNQWSALGSGVNDERAVVSLVVMGNDLYAGGGFSEIGGIDANGIARWDGTAWSKVGSGVDARSFGMTALAVWGSDLYAAGGFTLEGGLTSHKLAKWNGSAWTAVDSDFGAVGSVAALAVTGNALYAGGWFFGEGIGGFRNIAKRDAGGWTGVGPPRFMFKGFVSLLAASGSDVYAGCPFATADGQTGYLAKWNGTTWANFVPELDGGVVRALTVSGTDIYAAGTFTAIGGVPAKHIAKWDGRTWSALGPGLDGSVNAILVSGTDVYAGGRLQAADGTATGGVWKWNGNTWSALGQGLGRGYPISVLALAMIGSDLYAGGLVTSWYAGDQAVKSIIKWNGSDWSPVGTGTELGTSVIALAVMGGDLYAGGDFTTIGGITANRIAKWNGTVWSALGSGLNGTPYALAISDRDLYAGGSFTEAGDTPANYIAKWNGSAWSSLGSGTDGGVQTLAMFRGDLYAGGAFRRAGGNVSLYVAKAVLYPPSLTIDPDGSGGYFVRFSGPPKETYRIQRATSLSGPWSDLAILTTSESGRVEYHDTLAPPDRSFYRTALP
ncbi:MAG TPA: hypothetical protein VG796_14800 [Verrucomicrobiales bacterium]|nr:hypothetical protein [Verrucomicrobiales bacterium]